MFVAFLYSLSIYLLQFVTESQWQQNENPRSHTVNPFVYANTATVINIHKFSNMKIQTSTSVKQDTHVK